MTTATFSIQLSPATPDIEGTGKYTFAKTWTGDLEGTSNGIMLSAGDPGAGTAGYVAIERFEGSINGRRGSVCFQQHGTMIDRDQELRYYVVPGSGTGDLQGMTGELGLDIAPDGTHTVTLAG